MAAWDPRAKELFLNALDILSPGERQAYLSTSCGDDASLRQVVEALLQAHAAAGSLLEHNAAGAGPANTRTTALPHEGAGTIIGNYKLLQLIGEGGFGSVFMAEQEKPVRRRVALKIIKLGMDTKQVIARFDAERQALAMMDHTHIARILDAGATDTGRPYFVMELVRGVPITEYCDSQNLSTRERLELFIPVCNAVHHAHQKGIIHRDLKPSNVMVTLADGKPLPKIIDFGIAKATNARLTEQTYFTEYHQFIGTPQYMSPEQAEMTGIDIDTRSDIYSLGVLLYELLTGTTPLDAKELRSLAYEQMRRTIREVEPPSPSTRLSGMGNTAAAIAQHRKTEPRKLGQLLRGELDWIVMRALEKDRTRRYDTPGNLALDIQRHIDNEPVLARPPSTAYAIQKFVSKHRIGVLSGTAVLLALLAGLTLATVGFVRAKSARNAANKALIEAQAQKQIAEEQTQLAAENAVQAHNSAREARLQLAEGLISQADALSLAARFVEAHALYATAYDKLVELKAPLIAAEAGLWSSYHQTAFPLLSLKGHTDFVQAVAISPDGQTALSGSADGTLKRWDISTGVEIRTFSGHSGAVNCVAITPDGRSALSGGSDKTIRLWDLASGKEFRSFRGHTEGVNCVVIAPDGRTFISGSDDHTLKLWDLAGGKELRTFTGHDSGVIAIAIAPDGRTALSGSGDPTARLWDLNSGKELRILAGHTGGVLSLAFAPDGRTALSGSADTTFKLWDLASGKELRTFAGHNSYVAGIAFSPDGQTALSASLDKAVKLWDVASGKEICTFTGHTSGVTAVAIALDGRTALSASWDKTLILWDLTSGIKRRPFEVNTQPVSIAIAPDGRTALSGHFDRTLKLWDLATGKEMRTFIGHSAEVMSVAIAPDGQTGLSGSLDQTMRLWDLGSGKELRSFTGHATPPFAVAFSPDGQSAVSGGRDKTLELWDLASGKALRSFAGHADSVFSVAIAPDGRTALSGSLDHTLILWDMITGKELRSFAGHFSYVTGVAITPEGQTALSSSADGTLRLWDLANGKELRTFTGHTGAVMRIAIAQDGRTVVSGSEDHTLKLWDLASGKELRTFTGHSAQVTSVAISRDGRTIFSGSADKSLWLWDFRRGTAQRAFESQVAAAQATLKQSPHDAVALSTFGEWYAFRGMDQWAIDFLGRARAGGAAVVPLTLARCYWNLDRLVEARREFQIAFDQSNDASEQTYLGWCIAAIDVEPTRQQRERIVAAADKLKDQANQEMAAGHTQEAVAHLASASASEPEDTRLSEKVASLQAWFGQDAEWAITVRRAVEHVRGMSDPSAADRAAKIGLLRPSDDKAQLEELLALAHRAVDLGKGNALLPYYQMALGMAEYRNGQYAAADEALSTAARSAPYDPYIPGTCAFYRAMSLFRQGKESEAHALAAEAASRMKPLPADEKNPLAGNAAPGDLILWMAHKEAMTLLGVEAIPATQSTR